MKTKTFFKRCPVKGCRVISGFYLTEKQITKDEEYICQDCQKENKLSKWNKSTEGDYFRYVRQSEKLKRLLKLKKSGMKGIIPANKRTY